MAAELEQEPDLVSRQAVNTTTVVLATTFCRAAPCRCTTSLVYVMEI